jgi:cytochrome c-type biogenesis protein CcmH
MMLWIAFALMTAAAVIAVAWPLWRRRTSGPAEPNELAIYRDQLAEIDRDRAAGVIGAAEADLARVEISRRLIAASERIPEPAEAPPPARSRRAAAIVGGAAMSMAAVALYLYVGSPGLPGQPLAARVAAAHTAAGQPSIEVLFAKVEAHLAQNPDDGRGWEVIAPFYMRLGRYEDATRARANALRLLGATAERHADLGEALVAAANGIVTAEAKAAFDEAMRLDGANVSARFFEGLAAEQDGNSAEAARLWRLLLADAPQGAQWVSFVRNALARVDPSAATPPPAAGATAAAAGGKEQDDMIRQMVERLASRLRQDGSDVDGWVRLVRSYSVLGEPERARSAINDAHNALSGDPEKRRRFDDGVKALGIDG